MDIFNLTKYNKLWLSISLVTTIVSIILIVTLGLNFGIDFKGGSVLDYKFGAEATIDKEKVKTIVEGAGYKVERIVTSEGNRVTVYTVPLSEEEVLKVDDKLKSSLGDITRVGLQTVGPSIGKEVTKKGITSIAIASIAIILYLAFAFRKVPKPASSVEFGITVIIAMLHDVLVVLAAFAVLGKFFNAEVNALFITAILTIIAFSIHDSIVVYDRIRENLNKNKGEKFDVVVNESITETLARSINLSVAVLLTLFALFFLGSESIRWFVAALIIGMLSGTYSSIFVATQTLLLWERTKAKFVLRKLSLKSK